MRLLSGVLALFMAGLVTACGADSGDGETGGAAVVEVADAAEERMYPEDIGDDKCALLTVEDVAAATGVPASAIEQRNISGCIYTWEDGDGWREGMLWLSSVREADSIERAKSRYARYTKDTSVEDMKRAKEEFSKRLEEKQAKGEMSEAEASTATAIAGMMPEDAVTHQRFEGIGNEAALNNSGTMYVRVGNVNFKFSGKVDSEDRIEPEIARKVAARIIANLDRAAGG